MSRGLRQGGAPRGAAALLALAAAVTFAGACPASGWKAAAPPAQAGEPPVPAAGTPASAPAPPAAAPLEAALDAIADGMGGEVAYAFVDLAGGASILRNADAVFPQASVIKLPVLLEAYRQEQEGRLDLSERIAVREQDKVGGEGVLQFFWPGESSLSLRDVGVLMMAISDNTAANVLIDRVGMESVNRRMAAWGVPGIRIQRRMMDFEARRRGVENLASPRDMAKLLGDLHRGALLDEGRTRAVLALMEGIQSGPFRRRLPEGARAPHKDGNLEGLRTGAGLLLPPGRSVAWAVMARGLRDEAAAEEALARMLRAAWDHYAER